VTQDDPINQPPVDRGQKLAEDAWFETRGYHVFPLPTGQGLVLKR
jgi:hypothetical protein